MAENVTGGKFKPDKKGGLIKTKSDFAAFNKLFGEYKDGRNIIVNTMTDLGEIIGRDKFYNSLLAGDKAAKARGEPGMFYKTYAAARTNCLIQTDLKVETLLKVDKGKIR